MLQTLCCVSINVDGQDGFSTGWVYLWQAAGAIDHLKGEIGPVKDSQVWCCLQIRLQRLTLASDMRIGKLWFQLLWNIGCRDGGDFLNVLSLDICQLSDSRSKSGKTNTFHHLLKCFLKQRLSIGLAASHNRLSMLKWCVWCCSRRDIAHF